jgi:glc operon protein GlcG
VSKLAKVAAVLALQTAALGAAAQDAGLADAKELSLAGARRVAAAATAEAQRLAAPGGAVAVVDAGGHLLYLERWDGTFPAAASVARKKARSAALFRKPTADFENAVRGGRTSLVAVSEMTPLQGGVPITAGGRVVGAIGVSGAASAQQDEDIANAAAHALEAR